MPELVLGNIFLSASSLRYVARLRGWKATLTTELEASELYTLGHSVWSGLLGHMPHVAQHEAP